jgi:hypothetical protein
LDAVDVRILLPVDQRSPVHAIAKDSFRAAS